MRALRNFWDDLFPGPTPESIGGFSLVRYAAREMARRVYHFQGRRRAVLAAAAATKPGGLEPRATYAGVLDPGQSMVIGGAVKLLALRDRFPDFSDRFNLIYLVSSALPPHIEHFVVEAKRSGAKLVWNQNGVAYPAWCGDFYPWFNTPIRRLYQLADYVVYQSEFCRMCADRYLGQTGAPGEILLNPVDTDEFSPSAEFRADGPWQLLAAGTSHHFYRVRAALDCLRLLRDAGDSAVLTIAGEFRWKGGDAEVRAFIERHQLASLVRYVPPFSRTEAPAIYRKADVLIHPKYKDPCPTVPIEAMSCGVPVIGSRSGGMPELVPSGCGVLIDVPDDWEKDHATDPKAMALGVKEIMANHAEFSRAARDHALKVFCQTKWLDRHGEIFHRVLQS